MLVNSRYRGTLGIYLGTTIKYQNEMDLLWKLVIEPIGAGKKTFCRYNQFYNRFLIQAYSLHVYNIII